MWTGEEKTLAGFAAGAKIPYGMSTVATTTPEDVAPYLGDMGWFQTVSYTHLTLPTKA